jgi:hypothetical protein
MCYIDNKEDNMKNKIIKYKDNDGKEIELEIIKEFKYNNKNYAVLYEKDNCTCGDDCDCDDECDCEESCECNDNCDCECDCSDSIHILEIIKDDNSIIYNDIENDEIKDELIKKAEEIIYKDYE